MSTNKISELYNYVANLYRTELMDIAEKLEKKRKIFKIFMKITTIITCIAVPLFALCIFYLSKSSATDTNNSPSIMFILFFGTTIVSFLWVVRTAMLNYFASEVKEKLLGKIYKALDNNLTYYPGKFKLPVSMYGVECIIDMFRAKGTSMLLKDEIRKLKIFPYYDYIKIDDAIVGSYQGHPVKIIEFELIEKRERRTSKGGRSTEYVQVFRGALFQTSMAKTIKTGVFLKQKSSKLIPPRCFQKVSLESNEFEKLFEVYSLDQIESRYFLNTSMMDSLINLSNTGQKISGYINGSNINLLIHSSKDMFEPDINKPLNNPNSYTELVFQAKTILDIITNLNLDSKTGL